MLHSTKELVDIAFPSSQSVPPTWRCAIMYSVIFKSITFQKFADE